MVTTWELLYETPRYSSDRNFISEYLGALRKSYTCLSVDFLFDEDGCHVMVGDLLTMKRVIMGLHTFRLEGISVTIDGKKEGIDVHTKAVLDLEGTDDGDVLEVAKNV